MSQHSVNRIILFISINDVIHMLVSMIVIKRNERISFSNIVFDFRC